MGDPVDLRGRRVLVCGYGIAGQAAVRALTAERASVAVTADAPIDGRIAMTDRAGPITAVPDDVELVVVSPGYPPTHPLLVDAAQRGIPVWGEVELAWRLQGPDAAPWLALTGTNGKTTTVHMLESMLRAAGLRALAVGNVGQSLIDAVRAVPAYDVLAVELSSQQLHFAPSIA
ncbi:MAG: Mur ligase family protein, partial [Actinomycetota bacterium]|nr:Mur ligase family protein [Actinomycetota bacterium]